MLNCSHISALHGLTYSLMNSWTCSVCPVSPDASATVTLFKQCVKENTSPSIPRVKSLAMSAVETALLETLSFSLQNTQNINKLKNNESFSSWITDNNQCYISFSICLRMNSFVCAVILSVLLQQSRTGILFLTTLALVRMS